MWSLKLSVVDARRRDTMPGSESERANSLIHRLASEALTSKHGFRGNSYTAEQMLRYEKKT